MNVLMVTNTFTPHIGGVARSVQAYTDQYRRLGHRVLVIAPTFDGPAAEETDVIRAPSIQNINGSDFSAPLPMPGMLAPTLTQVPPDIVHSHHPFLLGDTALRVGAMYNVPIVFTHHTLYDQYVHYLGGESPLLQKMAAEIASGYCNLCDGVIAPSQSVAQMLREHAVLTPIRVIPTGVDLDRFAGGDRQAFRQSLGLEDRYVVGHVGRLAPEKNLAFLAEAVIRFLHSRPESAFLVVGSGPEESTIRAAFEAAGLSSRLSMAGALEGDRLISAYRAMDVFAFASQSETQGMVLTEAMAAGLPVVAVDGPGVRDVVEDGVNGRLLARQDSEEFAAMLAWVAEAPTERRGKLLAGVAATASAFSMPRSASRALEFYVELRAATRSARTIEDSSWQAALRWIEQEWKIMTHHAKAVGAAIAEAVAPVSAASAPADVSGQQERS